MTGIDPETREIQSHELDDGWCVWEKERRAKDQTSCVNLLMPSAQLASCRRHVGWPARSPPLISFRLREADRHHWGVLKTISTKKMEA